MERKEFQREASAILAGCKDRAALRAALHDHFGLSIDRARALVKQWFEVSASAAGKAEFTRAGVARAFRSAEEKREARLAFLWFRCWEEARRQSFELARGNGLDRDRIEQELAERLAGDFAAEIDKCQDADAIEALLVRKEWSDEHIAEYMENYGPE